LAKGSSSTSSIDSRKDGTTGVSGVLGRFPQELRVGELQVGEDMLMVLAESDAVLLLAELIMI
jgi:hypothetical protein